MTDSIIEFGKLFSPKNVRIILVTKDWYFWKGLASLEFRFKANEKLAGQK